MDVEVVSLLCLRRAFAMPLPCLSPVVPRRGRAFFALTCRAFAVPATLSLTLSIYFDVSESYYGILFH